MAPVVTETCPIFRSFDEAKARAFYLDWLRVSVLFEHRVRPGAPLYMGVGRDGLVLHLSEHHGDATPGSTAFVRMTGLRALHAELESRPNPNNRPGLESLPWGLTMQIIDPFGNRLRFCENTD